MPMIHQLADAHETTNRCCVERAGDAGAVAGIALRRSSRIRMRDRNSLSDGLFERVASRSGVDWSTHLPHRNRLPSSEPARIGTVCTGSYCRTGL